MNLEKLKSRLEKYQGQLRNKLESINPKRRYPQRIIENLNNKIRKQTNKIIASQKKEIKKATQKLAINKMKNKIKEIKNIGKVADRKINKIDKAYQKIIEEARKSKLYKDKPKKSNKAKERNIIMESVENRNKTIDREYQKLFEEAKKLKLNFTKKYDYFLRISFYKRGMSEEENDERRLYQLNQIENPDEEQENFYKNKDVEFDKEGNVYYNIWKYPLTIKLTRNPRDLKINEFYNDIDDGIEFIKGCLELFKEDRNFDVSYYQHFKSYINGFKIANISAVEIIDDIDLGNIDDKKYKLDDDNIGIHNYYTQYDINENGNTFKELLTLKFSSDYLKNNYRKNCCFLTAIINKYYNRFNTRDAKGIRRHKELTYDYLCSLLKLDNKASDIECSIRQALPFFTKHKLGLKIYDTCLNEIYHFKSTLDAKHASTLRLISRDNHLYELNKDETAICHKEDVSETSDLKVSSNYRIAKDEDITDEVYLIKEFSEIEKYIKANAKIAINKNVKFISNDINNILIKLKNSGLIPKVYCHKYEFYKLLFVIGKLTVSIEKADITTETEPDLEFKDIQQYKKYHTINNTFYKSIVKEEYKSYYHESVVSIHDKYRITANCGKFDNPDTNKEYPALDERKAYTECLTSINQIGVFDYFDVYKKYNNEAINDLSYYIIEVKNITNEISILFKEKISRTLGFILKSIPTTEYKILYYRTPYKTVDVDYKSPVDDLYKTDISESFKKQIVNRTTGLLEKTRNRNHITKIFDSYEEALRLQINNKAEVIPCYKALEEGAKSPYDNGIETEIVPFESQFWIVNLLKEKKLTNGLNHIKDIIYLKQSLKMYNKYRELSKLNIKVVGIKTDALLYIDNDGALDKLLKNYNMENKIGTYKIEVPKPLNDTQMTITENELIEFPQFKVNIKTFDDEYNSVEINKHLTEKRIIFLKADMPGSGKSQIVKNFDKDALFVVPYNELGLELKKEGYDTCTLNKFFSIDLNNNLQENSTKFDYSEYDTVFFDEIYLHCPKRLKQIDKFIKSNPHINIIGAGDCLQAECIECDSPEYIDECVNKIFPNQILLKVDKRSSSDEDRLRKKGIKTDIFENNLSVDELVKKYQFKTISKMGDLKTVNNICYFNSTCEKVNKYTHYKILGHKEEFFIGMNIKCKKYTVLKNKQKLNTNYIYKVLKIEKDNFTIINEIDNITLIVPISVINSHFKYPYSCTIDSIQGKSISTDLTIFDADLSYMSRRRLYTAITRARSLDKVTFFINSDDKRNQFKDFRITQYFKFKIENYKNQYKLKNREYKEEEYISHSWFIEKFEKNNYCKFCNNTFNLYLNDENNVSSDITADRINNDLPHTKNNCFLSCYICNCSRK
jgi:hypothetical protein